MYEYEIVGDRIVKTLMHEETHTKKVVFCIPTLKKPYQVTLDSMRESIPLIIDAGWDEGMVSEVGCPYISCARSVMLRKALDAKADVIVFIDHDLSWEPEDLLTLIEAEGDVVAGTYRFKNDSGEFMGKIIPDKDGFPQVRADGGIRGFAVPAGFLKITKTAINRFMGEYPELSYGDRFAPYVDLFNHGAYEGCWYGEDYSFSRRWLALGGEIIILPKLNISHWDEESEYGGNFHEYLRQQPGGDLDGTEG